MKKTLVLSLLVALLVSMFTVSSFIRSGMSDPMGVFSPYPLKVTSPKANATYYTRTVWFAVSDQDSWYVSIYFRVQCFLDGVLLEDLGQDGIPFSVSLEDLDVGRHVVRVVADFVIDPSSSSGFGLSHLYGWEGLHHVDSGNVPFFVGEHVYFSFQVLSPQPVAYGGSDVWLEFAAGEGVSRFKYCLDGEDEVPIGGNITLSGVSGGDHNVTVYGFDELGNLGCSETVFFSVEPFSISLTAIAVAVVVAVVSFGLVAYFLLRRMGSDETRKRP
jgi:hypothetical protein